MPSLTSDEAAPPPLSPDEPTVATPDHPDWVGLGPCAAGCGTPLGYLRSRSGVVHGQVGQPISGYGWVCPDCLESSDFTTCGMCDDWVQESRLADGTCLPCREQYCAGCCCYYDPVDEAHDDCTVEYVDDDDDGDSGIHNWDYRPRFVRLATDDEPVTPATLFIGMELEVEAYQVYRGDGVEHFTDLAHVYLKDDGSLNDGFEIVTHPMTLAYAMGNLPWKAFEAIRRMGFRSYKTTTCGMHLHLSRAAFKPERGVSSAHLWRFLHLHYRNGGPICRLSGRGSVSYAKWDAAEADHHYDSAAGHWVTSPPLTPRQRAVMYAKGKAHNLDRYVAINLQNADTIELRYFRGTLAGAGIKRNWQLAHATYTYTRDLTYPQVRAGALEWPAFTSWVSERRKDYPQLWQAMRRHLSADEAAGGAGVGVVKTPADPVALETTEATEATAVLTIQF